MSEAILAQNRDYWSHRAPGYSEINREELASPRRRVWKRTLTERFAARFPNRAPGDIQVLEVGTGPGFFAILLAEAGYSVTAIDLTPTMLDEARRNAGALAGRIDFREMNAQALEFGDARFDVVLSRNVTWNLPDPERAYREWARVLKPGGLLMTFDANWYAYLCDDGAKAAYRRDRENSAGAGLGDYNVGEGFDRMEQIARRVPLTGAGRPEWDVEALTRLGLRAEAEPDIWRRVWSRRERINFASTPMFLVCGYKA